MRLKTILISLLAMGMCFEAMAQVIVSDDSRIRNLAIERSDNILFISFDVDLEGVKTGSDRQIGLVPVLRSADGAEAFPQIIVAGRRRYIQNQRKRTLAPGEMLVRDKGGIVSYSASTKYQDWMAESVLSLREDQCGCGFSLEQSTIKDLAQVDFRERTFSPQWAYVTPAAEAHKIRQAKGSAYIDFKVNRTEIEPEYRRNPQELRSIQDTIDIIKGDPDSKITNITIIGYASPEGTYKNNARLAAGRTEALAKYVRNLFAFPESVLATDSVPEDWDGLRRWVEGSEMENRDAILAIMDMEGLDPDARNWKIKKEYPEQYKYLLDNVYPGLRHSDYTIEYEVMTFADPVKIAEVMRTDPKKLSLNELYVLSQTLPSDSAEFREVFELAVRLFPDAPVANLNAAVTALSFGDLESAERYLAKAGDMPETTYAAGILAAKKGSYDAARSLLTEAGERGVAQAADALAQLEEYTEWLEKKNRYNTINIH